MIWSTQEFLPITRFDPSSLLYNWAFNLKSFKLFSGLTTLDRCHLEWWLWHLILIKILIYLINQVAYTRPEIRLSFRGQHDLGLVIDSELLKYHFPLEKYLTLREPSDLNMLKDCSWSSQKFELGWKLDIKSTYQTPQIAKWPNMLSWWY